MPVTTRGLGSERSRHELPARGVRIAPRGMRGDLLAGNGGGLADQPAGGAAHQIEVNVVIVIGIGARREHGGELLASGRLDVAQKSLLFRQSSPAFLHGDLASVSKRERRD